MGLWCCQMQETALAAAQVLMPRLRVLMAAMRRWHFPVPLPVPVLAQAHHCFRALAWSRPQCCSPSLVAQASG
jgi:hypothetical protein